MVGGLVDQFHVFGRGLFVLLVAEELLGGLEHGAELELSDFLADRFGLFAFEHTLQARRPLGEHVVIFLLSIRLQDQATRQIRLFALGVIVDDPFKSLARTVVMLEVVEQFCGVEGKFRIQRLLLFVFELQDHIAVHRRDILLDQIRNFFGFDLDGLTLLGALTVVGGLLLLLRRLAGLLPILTRHHLRWKLALLDEFLDSVLEAFDRVECARGLELVVGDVEFAHDFVLVVRFGVLL